MHRVDKVRTWVHAGDGTAQCSWDGPIPMPGERITVESGGPFARPDSIYRRTGVVRHREWKRAVTHTEATARIVQECWIHVDWDQDQGEVADGVGERTPRYAVMTRTHYENCSTIVVVVPDRISLERWRNAMIANTSEDHPLRYTDEVEVWDLLADPPVAVGEADVCCAWDESAVMRASVTDWRWLHQDQDEVTDGE